MSGGLLALGFLNPALLAGGGLVVAPLIIHFLLRRRYRIMPWAATRFLLEAERENRRRMRIEQWLLIALRCLIMLLLMLLVARPFVQPGLTASVLGAGGKTARILVLDDSASTMFRGGPRTDFDTLREAALRLCEWLYEGAAGDPIALYLTSRPGEALAASDELSAAFLGDLTEVLNQTSPVNLPAEPGRVLRALAEELKDKAGRTRSDVYVLSDFQRVEWLKDAGGASPFDALADFPTGALRAVLIGLGEAERPNTAVLDATLERPQTVAGLPAVLRARLGNYSGNLLPDHSLQTEIDDLPLPPMTITAPPAGEAKVYSMEATFPREGFAEVHVRLEAHDGFPLDDVRRLSLAVKSDLHVLLVNGSPSIDPARDEVYFARSALAPAGPFRSGVDVEITDPEELDTRRLDAFDCIVLCNVAPPGPAAVTALEKYVRNGGGLIFFLGDEIRDPEDYNRAFYAGGEGLLPLPLIEVRRATEPSQSVGMVRAEESPLDVIFPGDGEKLSEYVNFFAYYRCGEPSRAPELETDSNKATDGAASNDMPASARILARFSDEQSSPAIVERAFGQGRVLLIPTTADPDWNDWARALDGSYVVALLEMVQHTARRSVHAASFVAGERLTVSIMPEEYEATAIFRAPPTVDEPATEGRPVGLRGGTGGAIVLEGPVAKELGTYTVELRRRDGTSETRPLCVNLDSRESELAVAKPHELGAVLGEIPHDYIEATQAFREEAERARHELWPAILVALLCVLMLEQAAAWWFGKPGRLERGRENEGFARRGLRSTAARLNPSGEIRTLRRRMLELIKGGKA